MANMQTRRLGPLTYEQCGALLSYGRNKAIVRIALNTVLVKDGADYVVRFHSTDIIRFRSDGSVLLSAGGNQSVTTKSRISDLSGYRVHQKDYTWYVGGQEFFDGIQLGGDPTEANLRRDAAIGETEDIRQAARMALKDYLAGVHDGPVK